MGSDNYRVAPTSVRNARQLVEPALTGRQIAVVHGVTSKTVMRWAERGEFGTYRRMPGNRIEVPVAEYQRFVERHALQAPVLAARA